MTTHATPVHAAIDRTYARFVSRLPQHLATIAADLPHRLGLTPNAGTPWSRVFNNPAVLGFPMLLLGATGRVSPELRDRAGAAHLYAIIGAFGMDRIDDGQIVVGAGERAIIDRVRHARDEALSPLLAQAPEVTFDYAEGERLTAESVKEERRAAAGHDPITMDWYLSVSWKKQGLAFPASLAAAAAAGFSPEDQRRVEAVVAGAALGLQYRDDVVDWMDDHAQGFAWAPSLLAQPPSGPATAEALQERLHAEGILVRLLEMSSAAFTEAAEAATALGAEALATWARGQAEITAGLAEREAATPGFAVAWERDRKARREQQQATVAATAAA
ncbi:MAG: hypothetical protein QM820_21080 [Minicystis sp.]